LELGRVGAKLISLTRTSHINRGVDDVRYDIKRIIPGLATTGELHQSSIEIYDIIFPKSERLKLE